MTQDTFYIITVEENGKYHAYVETINNSNNLVGRFPANATSVNACGTLKEARKIADTWNSGWDTEGKWIYGRKVAV